LIPVRLALYYSTTTRPFDKYDITKILAALDRLEKRSILCTKVDVSKMSDEQIGHTYVEATIPSVYKKYKIRQVFGSRKNSGWLFGKQVPALLVYDDGAKYPSDVYPHDNRGREVTIEEFLNSLLEEKDVTNHQVAEA
jgi:hypothetical protein